MKSETKKNIKNDVATGASSAAGAVAGVVIGAAISPTEAQAQETSEPEIIDVIPPTDQTAHQMNSTPSETQEQTNNLHTTSVETTTSPETPSGSTEQSDDEIQVLSYDRISDDSGNQVDLAVVSVNGQEVGVVDANLDGRADIMMSDVNNDGVIQENEIIDVHEQDIAMQPFQESAGFNPEFAQNDLPDYVNDADVDSYMA